MKHCKRCDRTLPLDEFPRNAAKKDGRAIYCRTCWNAYMRAQSVKHKERKAAQNARYVEANREHVLARQAAWREANKERIRVRNAKYRAANRAKIAADLKAWQAANPDKVREAVLRRIARRKNATTYVITAKDLRRLMNSPCAFPGCTTGDPVELDHVIPLSRGGSHGIGNIQPLCRHHNRTKHDKTWIEYRAHVARIAA